MRPQIGLIVCSVRKIHLSRMMPFGSSKRSKPGWRSFCRPMNRNPPQQRGKQRRSVIDKSVLALSAPRRIRDREHVRSVAKQPCLVCGRRPADAHHLRFAQSPALGRKVSDEFTVPLCRGHHREVHHCGDEAAWWDKVGLDPTVTARALWLKSHPLLLVDTDANHGDDRPNRPRRRNSKTNPIVQVGSQ